MLTHQNSLFTSAQKRTSLPAAGIGRAGEARCEAMERLAEPWKARPPPIFIKTKRIFFEKNLDVLPPVFYFKTICYLLNSEYDVKILATGLVLCARDFL